MSKPLRVLITVVVLGLAWAPAWGQTGTLYVEEGKVGVGIDTPTTLLHIRGDTDATKLLLQNESPTTDIRQVFELANNGGPFFIFRDTSSGDSYSFAMTAVHHFIISHQQTSGVQFRLTQTGNLTISGALTEGSSRALKEEIHAVDRQAVLDKVADLPLATWQYRGQATRHLGPMAEDFHAAFALGADDKGISTLDTSGVALAAVQRLYELVQEQNAEIVELRRRLADLEAREEPPPRP